MSDSEVSVRFTSKEEAQLWQSFVKLSSSFAKAKQGATETAKATSDLDKSLKSFAEREIKLDLTPWQAMQAQVGKLDAALKAGMLTPEQHAAAHTRAIAKMRDAYAQQSKIAMTPVAGPLLAGPSDELRKFAEQTRRVNASPLERYQATMAKLNATVREGLLTQEEFRRAAAVAQQEYQRELDASMSKTRALAGSASAAGGDVAGSFSSMLSKVGISIGGLTALTHAIFADIRAEAQKASEDVMSSYKAMGKLGQIGGPKLTGERRKMAEEHYASGAVGSQAEAAQTILELANTGALGDRKLFADLQKTGLVDSPSSITTMSQQLRQTLGEKEAGSFPVILARAMAAAEPVNTTPDVLLSAAAKSGQSAGTLGIKAPDLLAATTTMIQAKGADEGATRLASLLAKLTTMEGVHGTGLFDRIESIQKKNLNPAQLKKLFGDDTAVEAFNILAKSSGATQSLSQKVAAATPEILDRKIKEQMAVPEIQDGVNAAAALARQEIAGKERGRRALRADVAVQEGVESVRTKGGFLIGELGRGLFDAVGAAGIGRAIGDRRVGFGQFAGEAGSDVDAAIAKRMANAARLIPGSDRTITEGQNESPGAQVVTPGGAFTEALLKLVTAQEKTAEAADKLQKAADSLDATSAKRQRFDYSGAARRDQAVEAR